MEPVNLAAPGWISHRGQAVWRPKLGAPELTGSLLLASDNKGEEFIRFSKEPMEMVIARCAHRGWWVDIPAFNRSRSGRGKPPKRIGWFQLAAAVFRGGPGAQWDWSGMDNPDGRWVLSNPHTGERIEGFFHPSVSPNRKGPSHEPQR